MRDRISRRMEAKGAKRTIYKYILCTSNQTSICDHAENRNPRVLS